MKASIILVVLIVSFSIACKQKANVTNLEGTYISQTNGEYAVNYDTLILTPLHTNVKSYSIQSKTGFQKLRNGQLLKKGLRQASWTATWDENKQVLAESELGKEIQVQPNDRTLLWNKLVFKKSK